MLKAFGLHENHRRGRPVPPGSVPSFKSFRHGLAPALMRCGCDGVIHLDIAGPYLYDI